MQQDGHVAQLVENTNMLDLYHLPTRPQADVQIFADPLTVTNVQWKTWFKPRGFTMCNIICIGGGGGGGGGFTGIAGSARGGGGGGGSSGQSIVTIPIEFLPDRLYIQVGAGGQGVGSGGGTAGSGIASIVAIHNFASALNIIATSAATPPTGGGTGTAAAVGAAGAAGTVPAISGMVMAGLGITTLLAGQAGTAGGAVAGAVGTAISFATTGAICMGGTGGGGTTSADFAGGLINSSANSLLSDIRPVNAAAGSNPGPSAFPLWKPLWAFGGLGGGASNAAIGGNGGAGIWGSGGGGGGGGTTGGRGGNGGHGLVIIQCW